VSEEHGAVVNGEVIHAFGDRLIVEDPPADEQRLAIGIILPSGVRGRPRKGIVRDVGDDVPHLEPGDLVYYAGGVELGEVIVVQAANVFAWSR
jgi:co-chaperonin GroES (HSP10)